MKKAILSTVAATILTFAALIALGVRAELRKENNQ